MFRRLISRRHYIIGAPPIVDDCAVIAAMTKNRGIGFQGKLPWKKFPADMDWFRQQTKDQTVIMGNNTFTGMGRRPLPGRRNMILTSQAKELRKMYKKTENTEHNKENEQCEYYENMYQALKLSNYREMLSKAGPNGAVPWVIGGHKPYELAINSQDCRAIFLTQTDLDLPVDTYFPEIPADRYYLKTVHGKKTEGEVELHDAETRKCKYQFLEYRRIADDFGEMSSGSAGSCGEQQYLQALQRIMRDGITRSDRTGIGTKSLFALNFRYDLRLGFPLLTTKRVFLRGIIEELLWFLRGQTDAKLLQDKGVRIWDGNTSREFLDNLGLNHLREGDGGAIYGHQFRHFGAAYQDCETDYSGQGFDQIEYVLNLIRTNPESRRMLISLWNPPDLKKMALAPCHVLYHFWVSEGKYLHCHLYQRSGDMGLGVPFNMASASLLTMIMAHLTGLEARELVHTVGDAHIYLNHIEPLKRQITRQPRPFPRLSIKDRQQKDPREYVYDDFQLLGYQPYPGIKMDMAV